MIEVILHELSRSRVFASELIDFALRRQLLQNP